MLKVIFLVGCILGAFAAPRDPDQEMRTQLMMEFKDFIAAMPMQQLYTTLLDHLNSDIEMQAALEYVQGKEFQHHVHALLARPSTKELRQRYNDAGVDLERYEKMFHDIVVGMEFNVPEGAKRSFGRFLADIDKLMPYEKLADLLAKKLESSPVFIKFFDAITNDEMHMLFDKMVHSKEFKTVAQELEDMDVAVYQILKVLYEVFGWIKPTEPNDL